MLHRRFSQEETALREWKLLECFDAMDRNEDNWVTPDELAAVAKAMDTDGDQQDQNNMVERMMDVVDTNKDGKLSEEEWVGVMMNLYEHLDMKQFVTHLDHVIQNIQTPNA